MTTNDSRSRPETADDGAADSSGERVEGTDPVRAADAAAKPAEEKRSMPAAPRTARTAPAGLVAALVALAILAGIAAAGVIVWTVATRSWVVGGVEIAGEQEDIQTERDELMGVGQQFVLRIGTYGPDGLDEQGRLTEYREDVGEVLTPGFRNSFEESVALVEAQVSQSQVRREALVFNTGVAEMAEDSAAVLVAGSFTDYAQNGEVIDQPIPLRLEIRLVRVEGEWLVDEFLGIQAEEDDQPEIDPDLEIPERDEGGQGNQGGQQGGQQGGGDR